MLSVGGAALVVLLVMAGAGFARGMDRALRSSGTPGNVVLLGAGSEESLERSEISAGTAGVIGASLEGIRTLGGQALVSSEIHVPLPMRVLRPGEQPADTIRAAEDDGKRSSRDLAIVRGITPAAFLVHPQVRMLSGRAPQPGANEAILGRSAIRRAGLDEQAMQRALEETGVGATVLLDARQLRVVGTFEAPATVLDGEMWMPLTDLLVLTQRETVSAVIVALAPGADPADVDAFAQRRIDLELSAIEEPAYYAAQSALYRPVRVLVLASAALVGLGALLGGLNTMYAAFASRVREIGTLQCLGYTRGAIVVSMLQESLLAAMSGALIAVGVALIALDGISIEFSMGTFGIVMDEQVVALGLAAGALVGVAGSIAPAVRCLSLPLPTALKSE